MSNRFSVLEPDELLEDTSAAHKNVLKKAEKKLREIELLKKKKEHCDLSKEEAEKVASEEFWQRIVSPVPKQENSGETKNKKKREQRKKREEEEREQQRQEFKRQREQEQQQEQEQRRREQEHQRQEYNKKRTFIEMQSNTKSKLDYMFVLGEFNTLNQIHQSVDKTFRILSLKYHPDKNIGRDEWATAMQQHLVNIKDLF